MSDAVLVVTPDEAVFRDLEAKARAGDALVYSNTIQDFLEAYFCPEGDFCEDGVSRRGVCEYYEESWHNSSSTTWSQSAGFAWMAPTSAGEHFASQSSFYSAERLAREIVAHLIISVGPTRTDCETRAGETLADAANACSCLPDETEQTLDASFSDRASWVGVETAGQRLLPSRLLMSTLSPSHYQLPPSSWVSTNQPSNVDSEEVASKQELLALRDEVYALRAELASLQACVQDTCAPTTVPTPLPSPLPSLGQSSPPSSLPSGSTTSEPSSMPTIAPSPLPTPIPSPGPTPLPSSLSTAGPSQGPTSLPSSMPTPLPSLLPSPLPSPGPSLLPSSLPSVSPSMPTQLPTPGPTALPSLVPSTGPSRPPTTSMPTLSLPPTPLPTPVPTPGPSPLPTPVPSLLPSLGPSLLTQSAVPTTSPTPAGILADKLFASSVFGGIYKLDAENMWQLVYTPSVSIFGPEIESDGSQLYISARAGFLILNQTTGVQEEEIDLTYPLSSSSYDVITAMEVVDGTLYVGITVSGIASTATLATVDVNSGVINIVGVEFAFPRPCTGLAYDGTTMYGVTGSDSDFSKLYVVDLATGATSEVGTIVDPSTAPDGLFLSGLEFSDDGTLFAIPAVGYQSEWPYLYNIDPSTAFATVSTGIGSLLLLAITNPNGKVRERELNPSLIDNLPPTQVELATTTPTSTRPPVPGLIPTFAPSSMPNFAPSSMPTSAPSSTPNLAPTATIELLASTLDGVYKFDADNQWTHLYNPNGIIGPEIESDGTRVFASSSSGLQSLDQTSGEVDDSIALTFPFFVAFDIITAMEFVGEVLYAGIAQDGSRSAGTFATVDTFTGAVNIVGIENNFTLPCTGLAYIGSTMYAVTGTDSNYSKLYVVDIATGVTSEVGTIIDPITASNGLYLTGLEFSSDGTLFTIPATRYQFEWPYLYSIDPSTAEAAVASNIPSELLGSIRAITNSETVSCVLTQTWRSARLR